ncbi:MAG: hypothetical protein RI894_1745 [Bacteroidota bacterium]
MDIAGQYAHISMEMALQGDWLQPHYMGKLYEEQPPLLFCFNALSCQLFGFNSIAYRLPSLIFWCLGVWAVYHFGKRWYNPKVGYGAALIMASAQGAFLMISDVGSDTLLTALVALAFWQISVVIHRIHENVPLKKRLFPVFWAAMAVAGALLSNGLIGVFSPFIAVLIYAALNRQGRLLLQADWFFLLFFAFLAVSPFIFAFYNQHHSSLTTIASELWHYFWVQHFGHAVAKNNLETTSNFGYFFRTIIWHFLPWGIVLYVAVFQRFRDLFLFLKECNFFKNNTENSPLNRHLTYEWLSLAGFVVPFIALSFSPYKQPSDIYVVFPMASVLVAVYYRKMVDEDLPTFRVWTAIHFFISLLLAIAAVVLCEWAFTKWWAMLAAVLVFCFIIYAYYRTDDPMRKLRGVAVGGMIGFNFILNVHIYPTLLTFQAASEAGNYAKEMNIAQNLYQDGSGGGLLGFYSNRIIPVLTIDSAMAQKQPIYFYADKNVLEIFYKHRFTQFAIVKTFDNYPVKHPGLRFLDVDTRDSILQKQYLLRIK